MRYLSLTVLMLCLSGCRFGNHADTPKAPSNFTSIELLTTQARKFEAYAYYNDDTHTENQNVALSHIPDNLLNNFTNPLYLTQPKAYPGLYMFVGLSQMDCIQNPTSSSCIATIVNEDGTINVEDEGTPRPFGSNDCLMSLGAKHYGGIDETDQTTFQFEDGSLETTRGNLLLQYTITRKFQGNCTDILTTLASCYTDGTGCTTDELAWSSLLFDIHVKAGVLNPQDAPSIKTLQYVVYFW